MQTRSITRKLANVSGAGSRVSDDPSEKDTTHHAGKGTPKNIKNIKSKVKTKKSVAASKKMVTTEVEKRRSQRVKIEDDKTEQNNKNVVKTSSKEAKSKKKESPSSRTKRRLSKKKAEEEKMESEVSKDEEKDVESPPKPKKIKIDEAEEHVPEETEPEDVTMELSPPIDEEKIDEIKDESEVKVPNEVQNEKSKDSSTESEKSSAAVGSDEEMVDIKNVEQKVSDCQDENKEVSSPSPKENNVLEETIEEETEKECQNGLKDNEEEMAPTNLTKENNARKGEVALRDFDIVIERLPEDILRSVREKKREIGVSQLGGKKDKKKPMKGFCKKNVISEKNYIPLNTNGPTKFGVADIELLKKTGIRHPAVDVKRDLLYGSRIKRVSYSSVLAYNMKKECRKMRY